MNEDKMTTTDTDRLKALLIGLNIIDIDSAMKMNEQQMEEIGKAFVKALQATLLPISLN